jgi:Tetratricopeptide repeat
VIAASGATAIGRLEYQRPPAASQPVRVMPRPGLLAGRERLLVDLHDRLSPGEAGTAVPRLVALCGLGGTGKTSVAVEYAYRYLPGTGVVWQFPAGDRAAMAAGFADLAGQLGARDMLDIRDPVTAVHAVLAARPGGWLLIFDDAPDAESVAPVLPPIGNGQILITTQNPNWSGDQAVEVSVLDNGTAAKFLQTRTGDNDAAAARELAEELDGLPLALEQAAAYMQAAGRDIAGYLALYRDRRADLLDRGDPSGYNKRVTTTWALAFSQLQHTVPSAAGLLRLLACYAPETIPYRLLLQPRPGLTGSLLLEVTPPLAPLLDDPVATDDAIRALRRYSLISPPAEGSVSVHRLVQAVTLSQLTAEEAAAWQAAAVAVIEAAIPADPQQPATWPAFAALLTHAQAVLPVSSDSMGQIARYLGISGHYAAARVLGQQILAAREQTMGADHPGTLAIRADLADRIGQAGDAATARNQYAALLPQMTRVLGPENPKTLSARASLAYWTGYAGDAAGARDQYAALLPVRERVSGAEDHNTVTARANLARWTGYAGDAAGARDQYAALLPVRERVAGADHLDTLTDRANLAFWTGRAGDTSAACVQYAALLPDRERVSGAEHPDTLIARGNLAVLTGEAGDLAAARDQLAVLLPDLERVLGPEHPGTLGARGNLAVLTGEAGDPAAARDQLAVLLPDLERVLGPEDPDTLQARRRLASWAGEAGDPAAARDQLAVLLPDLERVLGPEDPDTLQARRRLASWAGEAGGSVGSSLIACICDRRRGRVRGGEADAEQAGD